MGNPCQWLGLFLTEVRVLHPSTPFPASTLCRRGYRQIIREGFFYICKPLASVKHPEIVRVGNQPRSLECSRLEDLIARGRRNDQFEQPLAIWICREDAGSGERQRLHPGESLSHAPPSPSRSRWRCASMRTRVRSVGDATSNA